MIRVLDLGTVPALRSQTVYHAVARALAPDTPNTIILVSPAEPYVCVGFHQDVDQEVDREYCGTHGLPVYRREVGGGAVYLDGGQIFAQWVFHPATLPAMLEEQFELYVRPLVDTYRALGIAASHRPINDVHVEGKKIGGTGAAQIGAARVLVGSLMLDFDKATMARVLKVPSEKMRDKVVQSLNEYMTTMREQLGELPRREDLVAAYLDACAGALCADLVPGEWTADEEEWARELDALFATDDWILRPGRRLGAGVKIHEDVRVVSSMLKAPGGLVRVAAVLHHGRVDEVSFSGDFTLLPADGLDALERVARGIRVDDGELEAVFAAEYARLGIASPGLEPSHLAQAIRQAAAGPAPAG